MMTKKGLPTYRHFIGVGVVVYAGTISLGLNLKARGYEYVHLEPVTDVNGWTYYPSAAENYWLKRGGGDMATEVDFLKQNNIQPLPYAPETGDIAAELDFLEQITRPPHNLEAI